MNKYILSLFILFPFLLAISAGKNGGSNGGGLTPTTSGTLITGELLYYDANGEVSTVPGTVVDSASGEVTGNAFTVDEVTTTDANAMGTWSNNLGSGVTTINTCATTNGVLNDNGFRITDLHEGGVSGTPGKEVFENCVGTTEGLDEKTFKWQADGIGATSTIRCIQTGTDASQAAVMTTQYQLCSYDFSVDKTTGAYKDLYLDQIVCQIPSQTGFEDNECVEVPLYACDVDGGIVDKNDCVLLTQFRFGQNGASDCTAPQDADCGGVFPCKGRKVINSLVDVSGLTVTTGSGSPDILVLGLPNDVAAFTADNGVALNPVDISCTLWGQN